MCCDNAWKILQEYFPLKNICNPQVSGNRTLKNNQYFFNSKYEARKIIPYAIPKCQTRRVGQMKWEVACISASYRNMLQFVVVFCCLLLSLYQYPAENFSQLRGAGKKRKKEEKKLKPFKLREIFFSSRRQIKKAGNSRNPQQNTIKRNTRRERQ